MAEFATYEEMRNELEKDLIMYDKEMMRWYFTLFGSAITTASLIWGLSDITSIMYFVMLAMMATNIFFCFYQNWRTRILQCRTLTLGLLGEMLVKRWERIHGIHNDEFDGGSIQRDLDKIRQYYYGNTTNNHWDYQNHLLITSRLLQTNV